MAKYKIIKHHDPKQEDPIWYTVKERFLWIFWQTKTRTYTTLHYGGHDDHTVAIKFDTVYGALKAIEFWNRPVEPEPEETTELVNIVEYPSSQYISMVDLLEIAEQQKQLPQ